MKMKIKKDASNKPNTSSIFKKEEKYVYDNLMNDPCFLKFFCRIFFNIFMGFFIFFYY